MRVEPRPPYEADVISRLKHRLLAAASSAANEAEMAAPFPGHDFNDDVGFCVTAASQNDAFIGPFIIQDHLAFNAGN